MLRENDVAPLYYFRGNKNLLSISKACFTPWKSRIFYFKRQFLKRSAGHKQTQFKEKKSFEVTKIRRGHLILLKDEKYGSWHTVRKKRRQELLWLHFLSESSNCDRLNNLQDYLPQSKDQVSYAKSAYQKFDVLCHYCLYYQTILCPVRKNKPKNSPIRKFLDTENIYEVVLAWMEWETKPLTSPNSWIISFSTTASNST